MKHGHNSEDVSQAEASQSVDTQNTLSKPAKGKFSSKAKTAERNQISGYIIKASKWILIFAAMLIFLEFYAHIRGWDKPTEASPRLDDESLRNTISEVVEGILETTAMPSQDADDGIENSVLDSETPSVTPTGSADSIPRSGFAVVLGDSQFEYEGVYSFAEFLKNKGLYREVKNYAIAGCMFYDKTNPSTSLLSILERTDVQDDIQHADEIWLHLGGNDALARMYEQTSVEDLGASIHACLEIIKALNPNVLIRYVNSLPNAPQLAAQHALHPIEWDGHAISDAQMSKLCESSFLIDYILATTQMNIIVARLVAEDYIFEFLDNDLAHPTAKASTAWFEGVLAAGYTGTRRLDNLYIDSSSDLKSLHSLVVATNMLQPDYEVCAFFNDRLNSIAMHTEGGVSYGTVSSGGRNRTLVVVITPEEISVW